MIGALSTAVLGLHSAVSSATQSAGNVVKASSTGKNLDGDLVNLKTASVNYAADAAVVKTVGKMEKALLDIRV
ncbi:MAG: hypothetical protein P4M13_01945 [Alphaproteobacteria bacterium]|nr:hypothetical protein [Alphaproteobacteria bacterium]